MMSVNARIKQGLRFLKLNRYFKRYYYVKLAFTIVIGLLTNHGWIQSKLVEGAILGQLLEYAEQRVDIWVTRKKPSHVQLFGYPVVCTHQNNIHIAWWVHTTVWPVNSYCTMHPPWGGCILQCELTGHTVVCTHLAMCRPTSLHN